MTWGVLPAAATLAALLSGAGGPSAAAEGVQSAQLIDGPFVVHYWPGRERLAARLLSTARLFPPFPGLPASVLAQGGPVHIFLAPDPARFDSLAGGGVPEWGAGIARPDIGVVVLPAYASRRAAPHELGRVLRHELAHVALHRYLNGAAIPRWFDEGYARYAAGEWDWEGAWQLRLAFLLRRAPPLDSLTLDWPSQEVDARVAYLLATSAVAFLMDRGGDRALGRFLERWREHGALAPALRQTYGLTLSQFEEDWARDVRKQYGWTLLLSYSAVFWAFAGLLLAGLFGVRRRRDRQQLERLRATEPPDDPAFWLEPEEPPPPTSPPAAEPVGRSGLDERPV
jgi:MYXO-CTERM domain-containing protein